MVRLFDIENGKVVPTEHCYTLKFLKDIMDNYPQDYLKVYQYLFYMTCPNPDLNPFFDTPEQDKEELIYQEIEGEFSVEDGDVIRALEMCKKLYETPTVRAYNGIKSMLDKIAKYMESSSIVDGRDGNGAFILRAAKDFYDIRRSFKDTLNDLKEEQNSKVRGNKRLGYDEDDDD